MVFWMAAKQGGGLNGKRGGVKDIRVSQKRLNSSLLSGAASEGRGLFQEAGEALRNYFAMR